MARLPGGARLVAELADHPAVQMLRARMAAAAPGVSLVVLRPGQSVGGHCLVASGTRPAGLIVALGAGLAAVEPQVLHARPCVPGEPELPRMRHPDTVAAVARRLVVASSAVGLVDQHRGIPRRHGACLNRVADVLGVAVVAVGWIPLP